MQLLRYRIEACAWDSLRSARGTPGDKAKGRSTYAVGAAAECRRLLAELNDDLLARIALLKMEGYTNKEIATRIKRSRSTVERNLARIRAVWEKEIRR